MSQIFEQKRADHQTKNRFHRTEHLVDLRVAKAAASLGQLEHPSLSA